MLGVFNGGCVVMLIRCICRLQQWLRRKNIDSPEADVGPTAAIRCPHGGLMPEVAAGAKRFLVPERLWLFFYESAEKVKPEDTLGCSTFPSDSEPCDECSAELTEVASLEDALRLVEPSLVRM